MNVLKYIKHKKWVIKTYYVYVTNRLFYTKLLKIIYKINYPTYIIENDGL
jgi:hypothetical protein